MSLYDQLKAEYNELLDNLDHAKDDLLNYTGASDDIQCIYLQDAVHVSQRKVDEAKRRIDSETRRIRSSGSFEPSSVIGLPSEDLRRIGNKQSPMQKLEDRLTLDQENAIASLERRLLEKEQTIFVLMEAVQNLSRRVQDLSSSLDQSISVVKSNEKQVSSPSPCYQNVNGVSGTDAGRSPNSSSNDANGIRFGIVNDVNSSSKNISSHDIQKHRRSPQPSALPRRNLADARLQGIVVFVKINNDTVRVDCNDGVNTCAWLVEQAIRGYRRRDIVRKPTRIRIPGGTILDSDAIICERLANGDRVEAI